jgi:hypothetical protein
MEYPEQAITILCREMKWTYEEYSAQPTWLVQSLIALMQAEGEHYKNKQK